MHAAYLAGRLDGATISFTARYKGLRNRRLTHVVRSIEYVGWASGVSKDNDVTVKTTADAKAVDANLVEIVQSLLSPLYERFDFTRLPRNIVQDELKRLRERR